MFLSVIILFSRVFQNYTLVALLDVFLLVFVPSAASFYTVEVFPLKPPLGLLSTGDSLRLGIAREPDELITTECIPI